MKPADQAAWVEVIEHLLTRPGADVATKSTATILAPGAVVEVTVRAVIKPDDTRPEFRPRHIEGMPA